jgi:hypothetical protein
MACAAHIHPSDAIMRNGRSFADAVVKDQAADVVIPASMHKRMNGKYS